MELSSMSSHEIDAYVTEKENLREAQLTCLFAVETEDNMLAKQVVELQVKRKDLKDAMLKAKHTVQKLSLEIKQAERERWLALKKERGF